MQSRYLTLASCKYASIYVLDVGLIRLSLDLLLAAPTDHSFVTKAVSHPQKESRTEQHRKCFGRRSYQVDVFRPPLASPHVCSEHQR